MNSNFRNSGSVLSLILALFAVSVTAAPVVVPPPSAALPADHILQLELGVQKLITRPQPLARVAIGDPSIADVTVINHRDILITTKKTGLTSLLVWAKAPTQDKPEEYRLRVGLAIDPLKVKPSDPALAKATIDPADGLAGSVPDLLAHRRARIEAQLQVPKGADGAPAAPIVDRSLVALETQVMTEVKIVEVKRSALQQYGLNILKTNGNTTAGLSIPGSSTASNVVGNVGANGGIVGNIANPISNAFNLVIGNPRDGILGTLSFLENRGLARTYAEPTLTAMSGQTASFLAGGEFPVPVSQGGSTGGITIQYREFGVRLSLTPTVLARNRIGLKVAPEVSDLDFSAGITTAGVTVPALTVRRTDTMVELGDGESFVISGLVSNNLVNNANKVPWLGDIPILGAFFKSVSVNRNEKELVMIVTPHLVRPLSRTGARPLLPGASTDNYRPTFGQIVGSETGAFGFSK